MENFEFEMIDWLIRDVEGNVADLAKDTGGWTYKGLSSRFYPEIKDMFDNGTLTDAHIYRIYYTDYIQTIPKYEALKRRAPWLVRLLFPAKVHGSGDEHITVVIQKFLRQTTGRKIAVDGILGNVTAQLILELKEVELTALRNTILNARTDLVKQRIASVGAYDDGIRNRVNKAFDFAFNSNVVHSVSDKTTSDAVVAHAKLSSVSASSDSSLRGVQVVESYGWEQLPLGMDITIEIRGSNHAFDSIIKSSEVKQA